MTTALSQLAWVFLMLVPLSAFAQSSSRINLGTSLSTNQQNSSWLSPFGDFAFGFLALEDKNLFLLAIWFDKIPEKTVVWSANGDSLVQEGSEIQLTAAGELVLNDHQGKEVWRASTNGSVTSASLLDSGNFVLMGQGSAPRWESFAQPTDTLLPTQILGLSSALNSRESESNYSRGRFQLRLADGDLILNSVALLSYNAYDPYWKSDTGGDSSRMTFNQTGHIYLTLQNGSIVNVTNGNAAPLLTRDFYQRATLDYDGVFREYVYRKNRSSGSELLGESWSPMAYLPQDICMTVSVGVGSGICGFNSYCMIDENQRPSCRCPKGYAYLDTSNPFKGCKQNFTSQSCEADGLSEVPQFLMEDLANTDWPLSDFEHYKPMNENQCRGVCWEDCQCAVSIYRDGDCWKKKLPLSNGRMDSRVGGKALIKVRKGISTSLPLVPPVSSRQKKDRPVLILVLSVLLGSSAFLNFLFLSAILLAIYFFYHKEVAVPKPGSSISGINLRSFTYKELEEITNGFKEELGSGSCGTVYKGKIASGSINFVAVKKLNKMEQKVEKEFKTELSAISRIHHKNLVQLLGYCEEGPNRLLVIEFMSNGSLADFLYGNPRVDWNQRTQIAFGIARGLAYLHEECSTQIIHCDIKPQNVLLDDCFTARISDFGIAKLLMASQTRTTTTNIRGTRGYVAPEWFKRKPITTKVDVYSFGVMLFEIICCRKKFDPDLENEGKDLLIDWVCECFKEGKVETIVANDEEALNDARRLERMVMVAIWCIQEDPSLRPSMKKVTHMLEGAVEIAVPPDPFSFMSSFE